MSSTFTLSRNDIIKLALQEINILKDDDVLPPSELAIVSNKLNMLLKAWQSKLNYWQDTEYALFLETASASYNLGSTARMASTYVTTSLYTTAAASATDLYTTDGTGISVNDKIGIVTDVGTIDWHTVTVVNDDLITINSGLAYAAAGGNNIYVYTSTADRPLKIPSMRLCVNSTTDQWISSLSREEYFRIPNKSITGAPRQFYYDPQRTSTGKLYLWPVPSDLSVFIKFTGSRPLADVLSSSDTVDIPQELLDALVLALAYNISRIYEKSSAFRRGLQEDAVMAYDNMLASVNPNGGSLEISQDFGS